MLLLRPIAAHSIAAWFVDFFVVFFFVDCSLLGVCCLECCNRELVICLLSIAGAGRFGYVYGAVGVGGVFSLSFTVLVLWAR